MASISFQGGATQRGTGVRFHVHSHVGAVTPRLQPPQPPPNHPNHHQTTTQPPPNRLPTAAINPSKGDPYGALKSGNPVQNSDGIIIPPEMVVAPIKPGRVLAIAPACRWVDTGNPRCSLCMHACMHACVCARTQARACMCVCEASVCASMCVYVRVCTRDGTQLRTCVCCCAPRSLLAHPHTPLVLPLAPPLPPTPSCHASQAPPADRAAGTGGGSSHCRRVLRPQGNSPQGIIIIDIIVVKFISSSRGGPRGKWGRVPGANGIGGGGDGGG